MSSQLQHKLQQFEATPPKQIWQAIEDKLNDPESALQERLLSFEAIPPTDAWQTIEATLTTQSTENKTIVRNTNWLRYAAAAILLGIISVTIFTFVINQPKKTIAQQNSPTTPSTFTYNTSTTATATKTPTTANRKESSISPSTSESTSTAPNGLTTTLGLATSKRYKVVAKEDGKLVRLSQKAFAVFDCAVKATANKGLGCKENIQNMQEKMATSLVSPTADFAGLIEMIKTLEENK